MIVEASNNAANGKIYSINNTCENIMEKYSPAHRVCFFVTIIIETDDKAISSLWCQKYEYQRCSAVDEPKSCNDLGLHSAGWFSLPS